MKIIKERIYFQDKSEDEQYELLELLNEMAYN